MEYICLFSLFIFCTAVQGAFGNFVLFYLFKSTHAKIEREHSGGSEQEEEEGDNWQDWICQINFNFLCFSLSSFLAGKITFFKLGILRSNFKTGETLDN